MRQKPLILISCIIGVCLILGAVYGAESIMYGDTDDEISTENISVNMTNNTNITNNTTNTTVEKHEEPKGILHKAIKKTRTTDPFDKVPWTQKGKYLVKEYNGGLWVKMSDGDYEVAKFNAKHEICEIDTDNQGIIDMILQYYKISSNCSQYGLKQFVPPKEINNTTNNTTPSNETNPNGTDPNETDTQDDPNDEPDQPDEPDIDYEPEYYDYSFNE